MSHHHPVRRCAGACACRQEDEFRLRPEALKAAITPKTKLLIMPFPNNPTGAVMEREDLEAIAEVLRDTNVMVLSDEIYAELNYGLRPMSPLPPCPAWPSEPLW